MGHGVKGLPVDQGDMTMRSFETLSVAAGTLALLGAVMYAGLVPSERADLLTRAQLEQALGGAGCNNSKSVPVGTCTINGQGGQKSCANYPSTCAPDQNGVCVQVTMNGNNVCQGMMNWNCTQSTSGQCGSQYVAAPVGNPPVCTCMVPPTPCGAPFTSTQNGYQCP